MKHLDSYNSVIKNQNYSFFNGLSYVDIIHTEDCKTAIVSLNFSWAILDYEKSLGNILFPISIIYKILNQIKDADFKILITHFSTEFLKEYNRIEIERLISLNFDIVLNGHIHRATRTCNFSTDNGYFQCSSPSLKVQSSSINSGFILLDINLKEYLVDLVEYNYIEHERYARSKNQSIQIPMNSEKRDILKILEAVRNKAEVEKELANNKFLLYGEEHLEFEDIFNDPILKKKTEALSIKNHKSNVSIDIDTISCEKLAQKENYVVVGADKSGKTMLCIKIQLDLLKLVGTTNILPVFFDMNYYYNNIKIEIDIKKIIRVYYNLSNKLAGIIIDKYHIKCIVDNYNHSYSERNTQIIKLISKLSNYSILFSVKSSGNINIKTKIDNLSYNEVFLHSIGRKQIRELTNKWPTIAENNKGQVFDKIILIFTQLNIHFNYWTVSLFLWIFERTRDINIHNHVELLDLYIENLLERSHLAVDQKISFSYDNLKNYLSELAFYLYESCERERYSADFLELIKVFKEFQEKNLRIITNAEDVVNYLLTKGIILKTQNERYSFRLNGVFEYFLAYYMNRNKDFLKKVVEDSELFLSFENELEIYAGFNRGSVELLETIFLNTLFAHDKLIKKIPELDNIEAKDVDNNLTKELSCFLEKSPEIIKPLSIEKQDEFEELFLPLDSIESQVHLKPKYNLKNIDVDLFMKHIFILSRVLRSSDAINNNKAVMQIFEYILDACCIMPQYFVKELSINNELFNEESRQEFEKFIESYSPVISETFLIDAIGHRNMKNIFKSRLNIELLSEKPIWEKVFTLLFLVLESDIENEIEFVDKVLDKIHSSYIMHSILLKLLIIILFDVKEDTEVAKKMKKLIQKVNHIVNPHDKGFHLIQNVEKLKLKNREDK